MSKLYTIYMYTCPYGRKYIGQTCNPKARHSAHISNDGLSGQGWRSVSLEFSRLAVERMPPSTIQDAFDVFSRDNIKYEILLEGLTSVEANEAEKRLIAEHDSFKNGYNGTVGGDNAHEAAKHPVIFIYIPMGSNVWTWAYKTHNRKQAIYRLRIYLSTEQGQFNGKYILENSDWADSCRNSNLEEAKEKFSDLEIVRLTKQDVGYLYNGFKLHTTA